VVPRIRERVPHQARFTVLYVVPMPEDDVRELLAVEKDEAHKGTGG
jgi:hypothetical protein